MVCLGNVCVDTVHKGNNDDVDDDNNNNNNDNTISDRFTYMHTQKPAGTVAVYDMR
jgi:hypothetical protein